MNKTELIAVVAEKAELSKKDAEKAIKAFTDAVSEELVKGGKIQLVGFGTFDVKTRAARTGLREQLEREETRRPARPCRSQLPRLRSSKLVKH